MSNIQRSRVIQLYKQLAYMGREYPGGRTFFLERLHHGFAKNKHQTDPEIIDKLITHGEFVVKEIEALYKLRKYRAMKNRYYGDPPSASSQAKPASG